MANRQVSRYANTREQRRTYTNYDIDIYGNAVRQTVVPDIEPEQRQPRKRITREEIERHQQEANERAFGLGSFVVVMVAVLFVGYALFSYIGERGKMHSHTKTIKSLTQELNEKTVLNDNRLIAIEAGIDYNELFQRAIEELNMTFPGKDQVVWFSTTESEYISQYEKVPQNN